MASVDALSVTLEADASKFQQGMAAALASSQALNAAIEKTTQAQQHSANSADRAGEAHKESASAIGMAVEAYHLAAEAVMKVIEGFEKFGEAAIEAANEMDPQGALAWADAVDRVESSFGALEAQVGAKLRPTLIAAMDAAAGGIAKVTNTDWSPLVDGIKKTVANIWAVDKEILGALKWPFLAAVEVVTTAVNYWVDLYRKFKDTIDPIAKEVLNVLLTPFQLMAENVLDILSNVTFGVGMMLEELKKATGQGPGGDAMKGMSAQLDAMNAKVKKDFVGALVDGATAGAAAIKGVFQPAIDGAIATAKSFMAASTKPPKGPETESGAALRATEFQIRARALAEEFTRQQQADQEHLFKIREAAAASKTGALQELEIAKQKLALATGKLATDESAGRVGSLAADRADVMASLSAVRAAGESAVGAAAEMARQEEAIVSSLAKRATEAKEAYSLARAAADAADRAAAKMTGKKGGKKATARKAEADATADRLKGEMDSLIAQRLEAEKGAFRLSKAAAEEAKKIRLDGINEATKIEVEAARKSADFYSKTAGRLASGALGSTGGAVLNGGMEGFAAAGPAGAAAGAMAALLEASKQFKDLANAVGDIFQRAADTVGRVLGPIIPVINQIGMAIQPVFDALGKSLAVIGIEVSRSLQEAMPILSSALAVVAQFLTNVTPILEVAASLNDAIRKVALGLLLITPALNLLDDALKIVGKVLHFYATAWQTVWNGIVDLVSEVLDFLAHNLPGSLGDAARALQQQVAGMKMNISAYDQAAAAANNFAVAVNQAADAAGMSALSEREKLKQIQDALALAKATGAGKSIVDSLSGQEKSEEWKVVAANDRANAEIAKMRGDMAAYSKFMAEAVIADARATASNTTATQALTASMTNLPSGFKLASEQFAAMGVSGGGGLGAFDSGSLSQRGGIHIGGNLIINTTASPEDIADEIKKHARRAARLGGFSIADQLGAFTPGGG